MKRILVTGSEGMLGSDLVRVLSGQFEVYGMSRRGKAGSDKSICIDLTDSQTLRAEIFRIKPDIVIHSAAFTKVDLCEDPANQDNVKKQNTEVVETLIGICNEVDSLLIFFSTDYVFSGNQADPYKEDSEIQPINFYGQTKAWAEDSLKRKANRFLIFRITWLYGENGNHFPKAILNQAKLKDEISVVSDQWGRPTWTKDIAVALSDLLTSRKNLIGEYNKEIFHLGNSSEVNWSGFARAILDFSGYSHVKVKEISSLALVRAAKRPLNSVLSLEKSKNLLGICMRPWNEALEDFLRTQICS